ncbi:YEATS domain-containing protein 4 Gas41 [Arctopsyche grandis]|uniref:YEATS domain-containing protein 4 Gas41 n=1 Tax=Arctopsyche grandis TaxID=121162 RepID=UPI00406DA1E6
MSLPTDFGPDSGGRVKGLTIVKPIVYGNIARYFGKKREEDGHTHQWTVYVKPYLNEDMSSYVKKVHFKLHESYANPNRIVTKPPYEITETGWGEFEIVIKIYFPDPNERPTTMYHILKLFQSPVVEGNTSAASGGKKGLVSESYEEIVFQEPSQMMQQMLVSVKPITHGAWTHDTDFEEKKEQALHKIINAKGKVQTEITELKDKLKLARETIVKFKDEISKLQGHQLNNSTSA